MKFIILKKDKDSTIARNDSVFPVNNFFVVLTTVSSVANSFGIVSSLVDWPPESPDNQYHLNK